MPLPNSTVSFPWSCQCYGIFPLGGLQVVRWTLDVYYGRLRGNGAHAFHHFIVSSCAVILLTSSLLFCGSSTIFLSSGMWQGPSLMLPFTIADTLIQSLRGLECPLKPHGIRSKTWVGVVTYSGNVGQHHQDPRSGSEVKVNKTRMGTSPLPNI